MKVNVIINPILDKEKHKLTFNITEEMKLEIGKVTKRHYQEVWNLKEETIKKALIKLGWTPPKE